MNKIKLNLKKGSTLIITIIMIFLAASLTAMTLSLVLSSVHKNKVFDDGFTTKITLKNKAYQVYDFILDQESSTLDSNNNVYYVYNEKEGIDPDLRKSIQVRYDEDLGYDYYYFQISYEDFKDYESLQRVGIKVAITISDKSIYFMRYY